MRAELVACLAVLAIAGCAGRATSSVERRMILPPPDQVLVVAANQRLIAPGILAQPSPAYPDLPAGVVPPDDVVVCVELVVGAGGDVPAVRQIAPERQCEAPGSADSARFYPPVAEAVRRWAFFGAAVCTFVHDESECGRDDADLQPVDMKLAYRFVFTRKDGKGRASHSGL